MNDCDECWGPPDQCNACMGKDLETLRPLAFKRKREIAELQSKLNVADKALEWVVLKKTTYIDTPVSWRGALNRCGEIAHEALETIRGEQV